MGRGETCWTKRVVIFTPPLLLFYGNHYSILLLPERYSPLRPVFDSQFHSPSSSSCTHALTLTHTAETMNGLSYSKSNIRQNKYVITGSGKQWCHCWKFWLFIDTPTSTATLFWLLLPLRQNLNTMTSFGRLRRCSGFSVLFFELVFILVFSLT